MSETNSAPLSPIQPDPLLDAGSSIHPSETIRDSEPAPEPVPEPAPEPVPEPKPEIDMRSVIIATPITVVAPGETMPVAKKRRMDPEEMSKRPSWLPNDWRMDVKVRTSGSTAGLIDRYYYEPTTGARFRSKIEVTTFLETGIAPKGKKSNSKTSPKEDAATPSDSPASQKKNKQKAKAETDAGADATGAGAEGADVEPSGSQKQKKASAKRKKSDAA